MNEFLKYPTQPFEVKPESDIRDILYRMAKTGFQGRNLGRALWVWEEMLKTETIILLGLAGALVPAGMRKIIAWLISNRYIDCLVATGANLFHDLHETRGRCHYQGTPHIHDLILRQHRIDRIYDIFAREEEFVEDDYWIIDVALNFEDRVYTTREFLYWLGRALEGYAEDGILTAAARAGVPIYCPALADSSIGIALAEMGKKKGKRMRFDIIEDVTEISMLVSSFPQSGVIYLGGGVPKNFIQQAVVAAPYLGYSASGHRYAIQLTQDAPHWGGLSGCTFEEAQSWGKIAETSERVMVHVDATIGLPILVSALAQAKLKRPHIPIFGIDKPSLRSESA